MESESSTGDRTELPRTSTSTEQLGGSRTIPEWKKFCSEDLGIGTWMISKPAMLVLTKLKRRGHDVYLVGGCVRDLVLKRTPKDFDIITSADLKEVSSFNTAVDTTSVHKSGCDTKDSIRWRNCMHRDFTINGFMFDPFAKLVYDYMGGMEDIGKSKVRTMIPANASFKEDCARILRAIRIAARLGFDLSGDVARVIRNLSPTVLNLNKGRIHMEMNYMFSFGSAEPSLRLLSKFHLLDLVLPTQADYFQSRRRGFTASDDGDTNLLLCLFAGLDKLVSPDRPCHACLWVGLLAFQQSLMRGKPRDPLTVAAFCIAVNNGGDVGEAVMIAMERCRSLGSCRFRELSSMAEDDGYCGDALARGVADVAVSVMATTLVGLKSSVPPGLRIHAQSIFLCLQSDDDNGGACLGVRERVQHVPRRTINNHLLSSGIVTEVRHAFARVVFDTLFPLK